MILLQAHLLPPAMFTVGLFGIIVLLLISRKNDRIREKEDSGMRS